MKKILYLFLIIFSLSSSKLSAFDSDDIVGLWKTADTQYGFSHVEIYKENNMYQGRIIHLSVPNYTQDEEKQFGGDVKKDEPRRDINNPDKSKRNDAVLGLQIVTGFVFNGRQWRNGRIYDPESGKTYKGKMWLNKNGTLGLRGFVGISAFGRSTVWTPVIAPKNNHDLPSEH